MKKKKHPYTGSHGEGISALREIVEQGYKPTTMYDHMRLLGSNADKKTKDDFRCRTLTCDSMHYFRDGSVKLIANDPILTKNPEELLIYEGNIVLSDIEWYALDSREHNVLHIPKERVEEIDGKGYSSETILESPEWRFLARNDEETLSGFVEYTKDSEHLYPSRHMGIDLRYSVGHIARPIGYHHSDFRLYPVLAEKVKGLISPERAVGINHELFEDLLRGEIK